MKRTSKKLLSFILAVVMVVTSCSVGFTAFAADGSSQSTGYWNNTTDAEDAYKSIQSLIDQLVPTILGIEVENEGSKKTIGELLGMSEDDIKNADLQTVVSKASPKLMSLLSSSKVTDETVKNFILNHSDKTGISGSQWNDKYIRYFSYLNGNGAQDMSFYDLYNFCENNKGSSDTELANYCEDTLKKLDALLAVCAAAERGYDSTSVKTTAAYQSLLNTEGGEEWDPTYPVSDSFYNGPTADSIGSIKVGYDKDKDGNITYVYEDEENGTAIKDLNESVFTDGVTAANKFFESIGDSTRVSNPAEALIYYYANFKGIIYNSKDSGEASLALSFGNALIYLKQAEAGGKPITTKMLGGDVEDITLANYDTVLGKRLATYAPDDADRESKKAYYYAKMIYTCLFDAAGTVDLSLDGNQMNWDDFGSSSFEAINMANLALSSEYGSVEAAQKAVNEIKFNDADLKELGENAKDGQFELLYAYINSGSCTLNSYKIQYLNWLYNADTNHNEFSLLNNALCAGVKTAWDYVPLFNSNLKAQTAARNGGTPGSLLKTYNETCSGLLTSKVINSGNAILSANYASRPIFDYNEVIKYETAIKPAVSQVAYDYSKYPIPEKYVINAVNTKINDLLKTYLMPDSNNPAALGNTVSKILDELLETEGVKLYTEDGKGVLNDLWLQLYKAPVETIFNLIPVLTVVLDEVALPILLSGKEDAKYGAFDFLPKNLGWFLYDDNKTINSNDNLKIGMTTFSFDLNTILPAVLTLLDKNGGYDEAHKIVPTYGEWASDNKITLKTDEKTQKPVASEFDSSVLMLTGVYAADKWLTELNLSDVLDNIDKDSAADKKLDPNLKAGIKELIFSIIPLALDATNETIEKTKNIYKYTKPGDVDADSAIIQRGLNNISVALPYLFDSLGKKILAKADASSDWTALYDGKLNYTDVEKTFKDGKVTQVVNNGVQELKSYAVNKNPAGVLTCLIDTVIGNWLNGSLDLVNDILTTDNDITNNLSLVTGLLNALGGFGEKSILTDVLNGFFDLTREDDASFTLEKNTKTGFVGLTTKSALFLISNISYKDGDTYKGLVPLIQGLIVGGNNASTTSNQSASAADNSISLQSAVASSRAAKASSQTVKAADELVEKLDEVLNSLLENTKLNGFTIDSNSGVLAGALSAVSKYIGKDNTNKLISLLDEYLKVYETEPQSGKVNKEVYSNSNLNNIVKKTYTLLENIVDYVFYDMDKAPLANKDENRVIAGAITGIISPDSVALRMDSGYKKAANDLKGKKSWSEVGNVNFGVSTGNKDQFYSALGQSMSGIAAILSAVLTYSYADSNKNGNYYSELFYPVLSTIADKTGASGVLTPAQFADMTPAEQLIKGIGAPLANIFEQFYDAPATFLLNVVASLGDLLNDSEIKNIVNGAINPVNNLLNGLFTVISDTLSAPSLAKYLKSKITFYPVKVDMPDKDIFINLIGSIKVGNKTLGAMLNLKSIDWKALSNAKSAGEVLVLVYNYLAKTVLQSETVMGAVNGLAPEIGAILSKLDADQLFTVLKNVLSISSPTEVYWTFKQYAGKITNTFVYPKNITSSEAQKAVKSLDEIVKNIFPLLNSLGVTNIKSLDALVNDNLYTNKLLTSMATGIYGAIEKVGKENGIEDITGKLFSTSAVASLLTDSSYGETFSSAASTIRNAGSWSNVKNVNWGFKDGSANAQKGFINGLAAVLRPLNDLLTVFLADGKALGDSIDIDAIIKGLNVNTSFDIASDSNAGCTVYLKMAGGVLTATIDSKMSNENSTLTVDLNAIINNWKLGAFGTNGYESAIVPLLEAFMCKGVKTYSQYIADYKKAKDNLLIDILTPLFGFVNEVVATPADTLTAVLPNVAYFIDSNGLAQVVNNLLAPITSKDGLVGALSKSGYDIDDVVTSIVGKPLGRVITDALGINVNLTMNIADLNSCNIQDIVVPLVRKLLADNGLNLKIPNISFASLASLGTITTVKSAAKNADGRYETRRVVADQGKVLVSVLRYVADVLIKNATAINNLLGNIDAIKKNKTLKDILACVFNSIKAATPDDIVRALFYFLAQTGTLGVPEDSFFDYSNFKTIASTFTFGNMDEDFCRKLAPMLDGLIGGLLPDGLGGLVSGAIYKDDIISSIATGLYGAVEGVKVGKIGSLTSLLEKTGIDFTTKNVAALLTDKTYGKTFDAAARTIKSAGSWKSVNKSSLSWGVTDRESFLNALAAVLRPLYGVLDVILNNSRLNLFNIVSVQGSDGYTSFIVPLLEAFGCYNIKTQYDYRMDISKNYDALLLDILNPILDKVEDLLNAPVEMLADILPNLSLFFANDGLLQILDNLLTPVSAILDAVKPIINVNSLLKVLGVNLNSLLSKIGVKTNVTVNVYDLKATLLPLIGADNVVSLLNGILGTVKIGGKSLGIELPNIDWLQLASHGEIEKIPSQAATFGERIVVKADQDETLIAVLRFLINTINYKGNYDAIVSLVGGLLGGASDSISGVVSQVLGMLQGDADSVIESLVELLQQLAG
ncbi:hypothetical protein [uncultured Eubacterium sp.]|uniref:hypothetical protein n=1 Tax=uncultured Eubacterium sp. TaxID=165185 RepID=UPI0025E053E5|nr:hypothetical protein [uncultured Eubacterium sp.]